MVHLPGAPGEVPRVAYAINRRVGGAVVRNRLRRRLRAIVAELAAEGRVPAGALLVVASPPLVHTSHRELRVMVERALARLDPAP